MSTAQGHLTGLSILELQEFTAGRRWCCDDLKEAAGDIAGKAHQRHNANPGFNGNWQSVGDDRLTYDQANGLSSL